MNTGIVRRRKDAVEKSTEAVAFRRKEALKKLSLARSREALKRALGYVTAALAAGSNKQIGTAILTGLSGLGEILNATGLTDIPYSLLVGIGGLGAAADLVHGAVKSGSLEGTREAVGDLGTYLQKLYRTGVNRGLESKSTWAQWFARLGYRFFQDHDKGGGVNYGGDIIMGPVGYSLGKRARHRNSLGEGIFGRLKKMHRVE